MAPKPSAVPALPPPTRKASASAGGEAAAASKKSDAKPSAETTQSPVREQLTEEMTPPTPGAFWSAQKIAKRNRDEGIIWLPGPGPEFDRLPYKLDEECLRAASYNLRMGNEAYVTPVSESDHKSIQRLESGGSFRIPPGQFAFLLTHEAVRIPNDTFALVALRARELQFKGLINVSGFHIDPGYNGRLVLAVYNAGPSEVHLRQGAILFEVFFADLDGPTNRAYGTGSSKKPLMRIEPEIISAIAGEFETLKGLKNRIDEVEGDLEDRIHSLEREQSVVKWAGALILGALIAFGVKDCSAGVSRISHVVPAVEISHG